MGDASLESRQLQAGEAVLKVYGLLDFRSMATSGSGIPESSFKCLLLFCWPIVFLNDLCHELMKSVLGMDFPKESGPWRRTQENKFSELQRFSC